MTRQVKARALQSPHIRTLDRQEEVGVLTARNARRLAKKQAKKSRRKETA